MNRMKVPLMRRICLLCFTLALSIVSVPAKQLALSFDDGLDPTQDQTAAAINQAILATLNRYQIKAIVFPAVNKIGGEAGLALIEQWAEQGHRIGNHSALHLNLNKPEVSIEQYLASMQQGHARFSQLSGFVARYRFPYLKEGDTLQKREAVRAWLREHHYQSGAVSIDASDWFYNQLYLKYQQQHEQQKLTQLKAAYISHLLQRADYYDHLAQQTIGRSPKHVLLLHVRAINAAWLPEVITAFHQAGWQFVDSDTAYQDPVYALQLNVLPAGESLLWSIAQVYGIAGLRYPAEDAVYEKNHLRQYGLNVEDGD